LRQSLIGVAIGLASTVLALALGRQPFVGTVEMKTYDYSASIGTNHGRHEDHGSQRGCSGHCASVSGPVLARAAAHDLRATEIAGGHAPNALPQRAVATLNCRLFPGHPPADVLRSIKDVIADNEIDVSWSVLEKTEYPASTLRDDVLSAMRQVTQQLWPTAAAVPVLETGGSDGRFLRAAGIPTYGASGVFIDGGDYRAHGRDERIRVHDFYQGVEFYDQLVRALASQ